MAILAIRITDHIGNGVSEKISATGLYELRRKSCA